MENTNKQHFLFSSLFLKIIAAILMTLDHIALLFIKVDSTAIPLNYYILRAIGKISFPIFAFLAFEGAYKSKNIKMYLLRLGLLSLLFDGFGYAFSLIENISIASNPLIGNAFTDMFMGVLLIYFLKQKNINSLFAIFPFLFELFSDFEINSSYGTLFKSDWGTFSIVLFLMFFLAKEFMEVYMNRRMNDFNLDEEALEKERFKYYKISAAIALIFTEILFYLIYKINYTAFIIPNEFVPIGTYSTLAFIFILLYNGEKGYNSKVIQYSFYAYYPLHLIILGIISMFCGVLANFM